MPSGAMASGLRLAGTRFLVTLLLLLLPVTCFVSFLLISSEAGASIKGASLGKELFMSIPSVAGVVGQVLEEEEEEEKEEGEFFFAFFKALRVGWATQK